MSEHTAGPDVVNHPPHYTSLKYIWRADEKGNALQDLEKARWYINRELERRAQS